MCSAACVHSFTIFVSAITIQIYSYLVTEWELATGDMTTQTMPRQSDYPTHWQFREVVKSMYISLCFMINNAIVIRIWMSIFQLTYNETFVTLRLTLERIDVFNFTPCLKSRYASSGLHKMMSSIENISLWRESTCHQWIPVKKASDAKLWFFFDLRLNKWLSKHSRSRSFVTPSRSLWRHWDESLMLIWHTVVIFAGVKR